MSACNTLSSVTCIILTRYSVQYYSPFINMLQIYSDVCVVLFSELCNILDLNLDPGVSSIHTLMIEPIIILSIIILEVCSLLL